MKTVLAVFLASLAAIHAPARSAEPPSCCGDRNPESSSDMASKLDESYRRARESAALLSATFRQQPGNVKALEQAAKVVETRLAQLRFELGERGEKEGGGEKRGPKPDAGPTPTAAETGAGKTGAPAGPVTPDRPGAPGKVPTADEIRARELALERTHRRAGPNLASGAALPRISTVSPPQAEKALAEAGASLQALRAQLEDTAAPKEKAAALIRDLEAQLEKAVEPARGAGER